MIPNKSKICQKSNNFYLFSTSQFYFSLKTNLEILIKLMNKVFSQASRTQPNYQTIDQKPEKEQWAIINKYKAIQFERMKAKEREIDRQKKLSYRQQLDNQLNSRNNHQLYQKQQDRVYYEHLNSVAQQQRIKEEAQKLQRFKTRKNLDSQNIQKLQQSRSRNSKDGDTGYHLEIGLQSEKQHREKSYLFKKQMIDTLDLQLKQKDQQQRKDRMKNQQAQQKHKKIQEDYFKPRQRKMYTQNEKIYQYYNQIEQQRQLKQEQLNARFIQDARLRKQQADAQRERQQHLKKHAIKSIVKDTLGQQMKQNQRKRIQESITNPQLLSYGCMSSVFELKYKVYNKQQYKKDLMRQAQQQRQRKRRQNHMNQQQYRFNMNQLSKAVMGDYAQKNYLDRSLGAIGEKYDLSTIDADIKDKDVQVIKQKLSTMRNRGNLSLIQ